MSDPAHPDPGPASGVDASAIDASALPQRDLVHLRGARDRKYQVVVTREALDLIHAHGREKTDVEICGVLVGKLYRDALGPYLLIHHAARGTQATQKAAQVTFTAETWEKINAELERRAAAGHDEKIVGWYHTHPGFGIFLSGMDLFIQDNFFNLPFQVAFVYDPVGGDEGAFVWRDGKSEREPFLIEEDPGDAGYDWKAAAARSSIRHAPGHPKSFRELVNDPRYTPWIAIAAFVVMFWLSYSALQWIKQKPPTTQPSQRGLPTNAVPPAKPGVTR